MDRLGLKPAGAEVQRPPLLLATDDMDYWTGAKYDEVPHIHVGKLCARRPGVLPLCDMRKESP